MNDTHPKRLKFGKFEFDTDRLALYFEGELVKIEKQANEVLATLLRSATSLVRTQEIIDEVWHESPHGITPMHVSQAIRKLRRAFEEIEPETTFIETVKRSGYIFLPKLEQTERNADPPPPPVSRQIVSESRSNRKAHFAIGTVLLVGLFLVAAWMLYPTANDNAEVKRVVEESQRWESLVLYKDPGSFQESDLDKYWTAEIDPGSNYDRQNIRTGVRNLMEKEWHYGPETRNVQFEFQSAEVNANGEMAVVKTLEEWFIAVYSKDGTLVKNKTVGPYFVSYIVRKIDGRWLIEKSTTARATPPPPVLASIEPVGETSAGIQFFVRFSGTGFDPKNVFLRVIGPGCLQETPCTVPNSALRIHSQMSGTTLENVPLTLGSGEFRIQLQNGESVPSNPLTLTVP